MIQPPVKLDSGYQFVLERRPRGYDYPKKISNSCNAPWKTMVVDFNSNVLICSCDGWLPIPVGQVQDFDSIEEVFNSPVAKTLQQDVLDKKFTWCAVEHCGILHRSRFERKYWILINIDESCNLACPSCRTETMMHKSGSEFDKKIQNIQKIISWLDKFQEEIQITLTGNGDPLASLIIRPLIKSWQPKPNQFFFLHTNGLLINKHLPDSPLLPQIHYFNISVDAGSKSVYEDVRRPGKWNQLLENLDYIDSIDKNHLTNLNFAVQKNNFRDLPNFVKLCQQYGFRANIHQLEDWGTWSSDQSTAKNIPIVSNSFFDNNVLDPNNPLHEECMTVISNLINQRDDKIGFSWHIQSLYIDRIRNNKIK